MTEAEDLRGEGLEGEGAPTAEGSVAIVASAAPGLIAQPPLLTDAEILSLWRIAKPLADSRMFKNVTQAEQAFAKMIIGRDLGLSPAQAMQGLHLVEGGIMVAYPMLGQFVRARAGYDFKRKEHTAEKCVIEFFRDGESLGESEFTMEDAQTAKLVKDGGNWTKYPKNMLFARAMSNGVKWIVPEVLGGLPVYVEGELDGGGESRTVDGGREQPAIAAAPEDFEARLEALLSGLPVKDEIKHRLADAIRDANHLRPGAFPITKVELQLLGISPDAIVAELAVIEGLVASWNSETPEVVTDAEVVEDPAPAEDDDAARAGVESLTDDQLSGWVDTIRSWLEDPELLEERRVELVVKLAVAEEEVDRRRAEAIIADQALAEAAAAEGSETEALDAEGQQPLL